VKADLFALDLTRIAGQESGTPQRHAEPIIV
jgi:hypothetical protein